MIFRKQLEDNDCFRTVLGCLLDLEPHEVPDFVGEDGRDGGWTEEGKTRVRSWLKERGLDMLDLAYNIEGKTLQELLAYLRYLHGPDIIYLCVGNNKKNEPHVVICQGDSILWDPSPINCGIENSMDGHYWVHYISSAFMRYNGVMP